MNSQFLILLSILVLVSSSFFLACGSTGVDAWKNITKEKPPVDNELKNIRIIARQSYWTIWYPGIDGIFGQFDKKLADSNNHIGLIESDPNAKDDVVVIGPEFYLLENQNYKFTINSWDVLHGVYIPSLRMSMNAVPGMETYLPIQTKAAKIMQDSLTSKNMLVCIKICGANHFKMKMELKIVAEKEYRYWLDSIQ